MEQEYAGAVFPVRRDLKQASSLFVAIKLTSTDFEGESGIFILSHENS